MNVVGHGLSLVVNAKLVVDPINLIRNLLSDIRAILDQFVEYFKAVLDRAEIVPVAVAEGPRLFLLDCRSNRTAR